MTPREEIQSISNAGCEALGESDLVAAMQSFERAVRMLLPEHDDIAPVVYENLGLAYLNLGFDQAGVRAFNRAVGDAEPREQSLRYLVTCSARAGLYLDARRNLERYERLFGAHPDGFTTVALDRFYRVERERQQKVTII